MPKRYKDFIKDKALSLYGAEFKCGYGWFKPAVNGIPEEFLGFNKNIAFDIIKDKEVPEEVLKAWEELQKHKEQVKNKSKKNYEGFVHEDFELTERINSKSWWY